MSQELAYQNCCSTGVFQRILVGVDDSEPAGWAIRMVARMARTTGAAVAIVHVIPSEMALTPEFAMLRPDLGEDRSKAGQALLERAAAMLDLPFPPQLLLKEGEPSQQVIVAAHEWCPDVIVLGTHGRGAVAHMLLGSTAESVVRHAHAPVLTVGCDPAAKAKDHPAKVEASIKSPQAGKCDRSPKLAATAK